MAMIQQKRLKAVVVFSLLSFLAFPSLCLAEDMPAAPPKTRPAYGDDSGEYEVYAGMMNFISSHQSISVDEDRLELDKRYSSAPVFGFRLNGWATDEGGAYFDMSIFPAESERMQLTMLPMALGIALRPGNAGGKSAMSRWEPSGGFGIVYAFGDVRVQGRPELGHDFRGTGQGVGAEFWLGTKYRLGEESGLMFRVKFLLMNFKFDSREDAIHPFTHEVAKTNFTAAAFTLGYCF